MTMADRMLAPKVQLKAIDPYIIGRFNIFNSVGKCIFAYDPDNMDCFDRRIPDECLNKDVIEMYAGGHMESILIIYIDDSQQKQTP